MRDGILIGGIVIAAIIYLVRRVYKAYHSDNPCSGCCGCPKDKNDKSIINESCKESKK